MCHHKFKEAVVPQHTSLGRRTTLCHHTVCSTTKCCWLIKRQQSSQAANAAAACTDTPPVLLFRPQGVTRGDSAVSIAALTHTTHNRPTDKTQGMLVMVV